MTPENIRKPRRSIRILITLIQILISVALIVWLFRRIDLEEFIGVLRRSDPLMVLLACLNFYLGIFFSGLKWQFILRLEGFKLPIGRLVRWMLIGSFANNFLPTDIGGDVGRILIATRSVGNPVAVTRTVFVERLSGLFVIMAISLLALIYFGIWLELVLVIGAVMLGWQAVRRILAKSQVSLPEAWLAHLQMLSTLQNQYFGDSIKLVVILILSLLIQFLGGVGVWLNFKAVGVELPLSIVYLVASVASLASILPLSVNGWGIRESIFIAFLGSRQILPSSILAALFLGRILLVLVTLIGPVLAVLESGPRRRDALIESEKW